MLSRTADRVWSSSLGLGQEAKNSLPQVTMFQNITHGVGLGGIFCNLDCINLLKPEFYIKIFAHPVDKMRIIQEPKKVAL